MKTALSSPLKSRLSFPSVGELAGLPSIDLNQGFVSYGEDVAPQASFRGLFPNSLKNCLSGFSRQVFQVAAGEVFYMWGPALAHCLGSKYKLSIFDPQFKSIMERHPQNSVVRQLMSSRNSPYPDDINPVSSLLLHIGNADIRSAAFRYAKEKGLPLIVEKPIAANVQELEELDSLIERNRLPFLYAVSFRRAMRGAETLLFHGSTPFRSALEIEVDKVNYTNLSGYPLVFPEQIKKIELFYIQAGGQGSASQINDSQLGNWRTGGGMLSALGCHELAILMGNGFQIEKIESAFFGAQPFEGLSYGAGTQYPNGTYPLIAPNLRTADCTEVAASLECTLSTEIKKGIPLSFKVGKYGAISRTETIYHLEGGQEVKFQYQPERSGLLTWTDGEDVLLRVKSRVDPYLLSVIEAFSFLEHGKTGVFYARPQIEALRAFFQIQKLVREGNFDYGDSQFLTF